MAGLIYRLRLHLARLIDPRPPILTDLQDSITRFFAVPAGEVDEAVERKRALDAWVNRG